MRSGSRPEEHPSDHAAVVRGDATSQDEADGGPAAPPDGGSADDGSAHDGSAHGGPAAPAPGERRARLQALAGMRVLGSDGATVGRVRDVYLHDATAQLAAITVVRRQLSSGAVLIPASMIAELPTAQAHGAPRADGSPAAGGAADGQRAGGNAGNGPRAGAAGRRARRSTRALAIRLHVDAATAKHAVPPPVTGHATAQELRAAAAALGSDEAPAA